MHEGKEQKQLFCLESKRTLCDILRHVALPALRYNNHSSAAPFLLGCVVAGPLVAVVVALSVESV